ncbi:MAG: NAD(+) diphosphatase [Acidimicrobiales bacterium]
MFEPTHHRVDGLETDRVFLVRDDQLLVEDDRLGRAATVSIEDATSISGRRPSLIVGHTRTTLYWVDELPSEAPIPERFRLDGLRGLHGRLSDIEWNIGGRATQLLAWYRDHQFCGRCGGRTEMASGERAMRCPVDGYSAYPRLSPAVIVLVERDDGRALLGRSGRWDTPMYSTLAGFVEPGETLEDTVKREIREEVGVEVTDINYFGSQPWPFPNSLMLGFTAMWAGGDIRVDDDEIVDAQWFRHDDLPLIPPHLSIARRLIDAWIERQANPPHA